MPSPQSRRMAEPLERVRAREEVPRRGVGVEEPVPRKVREEMRGAATEGVVGQGNELRVERVDVKARGTCGGVGGGG